MNTVFDRAVDFILRPDIEGESSMVRNDPGNWTGGSVGVGELKGTKFGISAKAYPKLDIQSLTREAAKGIYFQDYWTYMKCHQLPSPLAILVFDAAVNQGPGAAAYMLQEAVGVKQDGMIGLITINAAVKANLDDTVAKYAAARMWRYSTARDIQINGRGWFRRVAACLMTALKPF